MSKRARFAPQELTQMSKLFRLGASAILVARLMGISRITLGSRLKNSGMRVKTVSILVPVTDEGFGEEEVIDIMGDIPPTRAHVHSVMLDASGFEIAAVTTLRDPPHPVPKE